MAIIQNSMGNAGNGMGFKDYTTAVIANAGTTSGVVDLHGFNSGSILLAAEFDTDAISFTGCATEDGTFYTIRNSTAGAVGFTAASGPRWYQLPDECFSVGFLKIVTNAAVSAEATITVHRCVGAGSGGLTTSVTVSADTEMPAAAALADTTANPTTTLVGAMGHTFNGTTWDRVKSGAGAVAVGVQRMTLASDDPAVASLGVLDDWDNAASDGASVSGDVAHGSADAGEPVKLGVKAGSALPTAVSANQRANVPGDLFGRPLTMPCIPGEMGLSVAKNYTTAQTGTVVIDPTSGKRLAITSVCISSYATTAARVILWFGANADTSYTAGTDQPLWLGSFVPSATATPGAVVCFSVPVYCVTADHELHITTDANISLDLVVHYFEW